MQNNNESFLTRSPDILARLTYKTPEEGGRKDKVLPGYRPQMMFEGKVQQTSGRQEFINSSEVSPGETIDAGITLFWLEPFYKYLYKDMCFNFYEGSVLIGTGVILEVLNKTLERH